MQFRNKIQPELEIKNGGDVVYINRDTEIIFISDLHIDYKPERPSYFYELIEYLDKIIDMLEYLYNPSVIFLGDLFNKDLNMRLGTLYVEKAIKRFKKIKNIVNGKLFSLYGNHENTYFDINPTLSIMDMSPHLKNILKDKGEREFGVFGALLKTPKEIWINGSTVKIDLMHFRKDGMYPVSVSEESMYYVQVYHDTFISNQLRKIINKIDNSIPIKKIWSKDLQDLQLNGVDLAVFGDFHIPIQPFRINNSRDTIISVPGSLGRNNVLMENYNQVYFPILKVQGKTAPLFKMEVFHLKDFRESYNLIKALSNLKSINKNVKDLILSQDIENSHNITISGYIDYVKIAYGVEWSEKTENYLKKCLEGNNE